MLISLLLQSATPKALFSCVQARSAVWQAIPAALSTAITARMPAEQHMKHTHLMTAVA
jgi:hypothetical protein